jgi:hypothetical protein
MITLDSLIAVMMYYIQAFNDENVTISPNTIHNECLRNDDGFASVSSIQMYRDSVRWTLYKKQKQIKDWPINWVEISVQELARQII